MERTEERQVDQIKIFPVVDIYSARAAEIVSKKVNDFCADILGKTGNWPKIKVTSTYVAVIYSSIREVKFNTTV